MKHQIPLSLGLEHGQRDIRWLQTDGQRYTEPFFEDSLRRLLTTPGRRPERQATPLAAWAGPPPSVRPALIILHVSRCGSTLLSQMLAALPANLVLSEAGIFDDILRLAARRTDIDDAMRDRWLAHAAHAFLQSQQLRPERLVIKLDCWHVFHVEQLRRVFPDTPLAFVYRDPLEVMVSLLRRPSLTLVRDTVTPCQLGMTAEARNRLDPPALSAAILAAFFRAARQHRAHLHPVPYERLPDLAWQGLPGQAADATEIALMQSVARQHAKSPGTVFVPDSSEKRAAASDELLASCARVARPAYEDWLSCC